MKSDKKRYNLLVIHGIIACQQLSITVPFKRSKQCFSKWLNISLIQYTISYAFDSHGLSFSFSSIFCDNYNASQVEEKEESVWASALSYLLYFVCDRGKIRRSRLEVPDIRVSDFILAIIFLSMILENIFMILINSLMFMTEHIP